MEKENIVRSASASSFSFLFFFFLSARGPEKVSVDSFCSLPHTDND